MQAPSGIWLPLITPFKQDKLDEASLCRLIRHYMTRPIDGLIVAGTTGEGLTLDDAADATNRPIPERPPHAVSAVLATTA